jgi:hypothetical protein
MENKEMMNHGHELLPKDIMDQLPSLGSQDGKGDQAIVYVKFFTPDSQWTWLLMEYDPKTQMGFGLVRGLETELGYFSLAELEEVTGLMGLPVERDLFWVPKSLAEAKAAL